nr:MAG TPA: hypothetical protein [Caudoviricetes sp.]
MGGARTPHARRRPRDPGPPPRTRQSTERIASWLGISSRYPS